jgi:NADPH-dependent 2,4-dienoyl-CoA reductase/sulfur reductase-like enzyme
MKKNDTPFSTSSSLTRRDALRSAASVGAAGVLGCGSAGTPADADQVHMQASGRPRVAIVGAGAGGIAAAYFLAGTCDVDIFEARAKIGGHCDSQTIDY